MAEEGASTEETPAGTAADPTDKKDKKKDIKNQHVLIVVGILGVIVTLYYLRKQSTAAANAAPAASTSASTPYGYATDPSSQYGGGDNPQYDSDFSQIAQDLQTMQNEIAGLAPVGSSGAPPVSGTTTPPTTTGVAQPPVLPTTVPITDQNQNGLGYSIGASGYQGGTLQGFDGAYYSAISTLAATEALAAQGVQVYYEPSEGNFQPIAGGSSGVNTLETGAGAGTTTYQKVPTTAASH